MLFVPSALLKQAQIEFGLYELKDPICSWQTVDPVYVCASGEEKRGNVQKRKIGSKENIFSFCVCLSHDI